MFERNLKGDSRAMGHPYFWAGIFALAVILLVILFAQAFVLTVGFLLLAALVFYFGKGNHYALAAGVFLALLAAVFYLTAQGQMLSLSIFGGLVALNPFLAALAGGLGF